MNNKMTNKVQFAKANLAHKSSTKFTGLEIVKSHLNPFSFFLMKNQKKEKTNVHQKKIPSPSANIATFFIFFFILFHSYSHASPIKTIVVLVMENRSFDHMLGWMKKINPAINGVDGTEWNSLSTTDLNSKKLFFQNHAQFVDPDPGHSFQAIREQIFGSNDTSANPPPMNGFAQQAYSMDQSTNMSQNVMNGFEPEMVAVYKSLVSEFAVIDR